jgi:hypothetical protein
MFRMIAVFALGMAILIIAGMAMVYGSWQLGGAAITGCVALVAELITG